MAFDVSRQWEKARDALRRKNLDYAVTLLQQCLELDPGHEPSRRALREAVAQKKGGKVGALDRASARASLSLARVHWARKDGARAALAAQKSLVADPTNRAAARLLAEALEAAGHPRGAIPVLEGLTEDDPSDGAAWKRLGAVHRAAGNLEKALACYEKALEAAPHDAEAARAHKDLAAEGALQLGYESAASSRELLKNRDETETLERGQRMTRGVEELAGEEQELEEGLRRSPGDPAMLARLAALRERRGDVDGAEAALREALERDATSFDLRARLGDLRLGRLRARVEALAREAPGGGDSPPGDSGPEDTGTAEARTAEARTAEARARAELAEAAVEELGWRSRERPTDMGLRLEHGRALLEAGRSEESIAQLQKVVRDPQRAVDALCLLGQAFLDKGLLDLAAGQLGKALERAGEDTPQGKEIRYRLGLVAERRGRRDEALAHYLKIYEEDILFRDVAQRVESLREPGAGSSGG